MKNLLLKEIPDTYIIFYRILDPGDPNNTVKYYYSTNADPIFSSESDFFKYIKSIFPEFYEFDLLKQYLDKFYIGLLCNNQLYKLGDLFNLSYDEIDPNKNDALLISNLYSYKNL